MRQRREIKRERRTEKWRTVYPVVRFQMSAAARTGPCWSKRLESNFVLCCGLRYPLSHDLVLAKVQINRSVQLGTELHPSLGTLKWNTSDVMYLPRHYKLVYLFWCKLHFSLMFLNKSIWIFQGPLCSYCIVCFSDFPDLIQLSSHVRFCAHLEKKKKEQESCSHLPQAFLPLEMCETWFRERNSLMCAETRVTEKKKFNQEALSKFPLCPYLLLDETHLSGHTIL